MIIFDDCGERIKRRMFIKQAAVSEVELKVTPRTDQEIAEAGRTLDSLRHHNVKRRAGPANSLKRNNRRRTAASEEFLSALRAALPTATTRSVPATATTRRPQAPPRVRSSSGRNARARVSVGQLRVD